MGPAHRRSIAAMVLLGALAVAAAAGAGEQPALRFARIFGDHMVLQQGKPVRIWGWAEPGAEVAVTISEDPKIADGLLPEAAPPRDDGQRRVTVMYVEHNAPAFKPQSRQAKADAKCAWEATVDPIPAGFTPKAVVARSGQQGVAISDVLVGEIWVCAGQSNMAWSNFNRKGREAASADFPGLRYVAWHDSWYKPRDDISREVQWAVCSPESAQRFSAVPYLYGMFLHRYLKVPVGIINVARGGTTGQTWCLREELDSIDHVTVTTALKDYDAQTAMWEDPKQVKRIMAEWQEACEQKKAEHAKKVAQAKAEGKKEPRLRLPKKPGDARSGWSPPAGLFNATIMPIRRLAIRGVLYYQGENQAFQRWTRYEYTFPKIPVSFRKAFGDPKLPFGCISQPGWGTFGIDPEVATVRGGYQVVRDIQHRALKDDPHAGLIATYPTGNSYIHPGEKLPVAEYASLWALARVYGKPVVHRANRYQSMKIRDGKIYLFFDSDPIVYERWKHIKNNAYWQVLPCPREGNAEFKGFIIAGKDRRWYPAKARHTRLDGTPCIEVMSDLVPEPVAVRYGWASWPEGNMVGRERLPLPAFRTDDWPLPVGVSYSDEVKKQCRENLRQLSEAGAAQALDRKIREAMLALPRLESELYMGRRQRDVRKLLKSKVARMRSIVEELDDDFLKRQCAANPAIAEKLKAVQALLAEAEAGIDKLPDAK